MKQSKQTFLTALTIILITSIKMIAEAMQKHMNTKRKLKAGATNK